MPTLTRRKTPPKNRDKTPPARAALCGKTPINGATTPRAAEKAPNLCSLIHGEDIWHFQRVKVVTADQLLAGSCFLRLCLPVLRLSNDTAACFLYEHFTFNLFFTKLLFLSCMAYGIGQSPSTAESPVTSPVLVRSSQQ